MEISKTYEPQQVEKKWYQFWWENGFFKPREDGEPYTILIPPPNVTGILHMGHVLNNTYQDVMIRYQRMLGKSALWLPGVDHAGIATQNVVEKELRKENKNRHQIGREALVDRIWQWKNEKGGRIISQLRQLGASCDWSRERFTMDDVLSKAVREVFVHLYNKKRIYRGKYIINWCPRCVTALANDEVEHEDETGKLWYIRYPLSDGNGALTVATTRPETMLGDVAVAVHPQDERFAQYIGKNVELPLTGRNIPVIADEYVEREFGTGCVKITPAHDPNDFEVGARHKLKPLIVMDEHGVMNDAAGSDFAGLDRFACRKKVLGMLEEQGLLAKTENHTHAVGHCYRCDTVIEPYLSDQWFVRMKPLAEPAIQSVQEGKIRFVPERWTKVYLHWMENVRDWCISRQIWWGHRIPAWYCDDCGEIIVANEDPDHCPGCGSTRIRQDEDVLDTWFSSWLWPFSTMGWPEETKDMERFLPTNLLITAPGIIYLWVARMIMSTLEFRGVIPFDTVFLHGMVLDEKGIKMSKSLGNSPDPIDIIETVGADALRFSMIFNTPRGQDSYYSDAILENGRNFANKIWNAFRFIMSNFREDEDLPKRENLKLELADRWIYSRLNRVMREVRAAFDTIRFNDAAQMLQEFIWREFCAWYLELSKDRIYSDDANARGTALFILLDVLEQSMRLLHPLMPFITEEIWQILKKLRPQEEEALIIACYPKPDISLINDVIEDEMGLIQECISSVRNLRKQVNLSPGVQVSLTVRATGQEQVELFERYSAYFSKLAKVGESTVAVGAKKPSGAIGDVVRDVELYLPLADLIDLEVEIARLRKQLEKLENDRTRFEKKLNNKGFIDKAPSEIVEREREKLEEVNITADKLAKLIDGLEN